ncbi:MAG: hypothetical protein U1F43_11555 [Myxococcota bacterium]
MWLSLLGVLACIAAPVVALDPGPAAADGWRRELLPAAATAPGAEIVAMAGTRDTLVIAVKAGPVTTILTTVDGIRSWQTVASPLSEPISALATRGGTVFVATTNLWGHRALWSSPLNAGQWDVVSVPGAGAGGVGLVAADSDRVYASDGATLWASPNGRAWSFVVAPGAGIAALEATDDGVLVVPPQGPARVVRAEGARQEGCGAGRRPCLGLPARAEWGALGLEQVARVVVYHGWLVALTRERGGAPALWRRGS